MNGELVRLPVPREWDEFCDRFEEVVEEDELTREIYAAARRAGVEFDSVARTERGRPWLEHQTLHLGRAFLERVELALLEERSRDLEALSAVARAEQHLSLTEFTCFEVRNFAACLLARSNVELRELAADMRAQLRERARVRNPLEFLVYVCSTAAGWLWWTFPWRRPPGELGQLLSSKPTRDRVAD
jgi:hypothetical protein